MTGRQIGSAGTCVRIGLGAFLLVFGALGGRVEFLGGHLNTRFDPAALVFGLVVYPLIFFVALWLRSLRDPRPLMATGPTETAINWVLIIVLMSMALIGLLSFIGFGVMVFYGATMLLAAAFGYAGCEVTAVSNLVLGRRDQVGCPVLSPIDALDHRGASA